MYTAVLQYISVSIAISEGLTRFLSISPFMVC